MLLLLSACAPPSDRAPADTAAPDTGDTAPVASAAEACRAARAFPLVVEAYDFGGFDGTAIPGRLTTLVARSAEALDAWLAAEIGGPALTGAVDWDTEVALVGWVDAVEARPDALELVAAEGIGGEALATTWCVTWPESHMDTSSRTVRVYALPAGAYTTVTDTREWWE